MPTLIETFKKVFILAKYNSILYIRLRTFFTIFVILVQLFIKILRSYLYIEFEVR